MADNHKQSSTCEIDAAVSALQAENERLRSENEKLQRQSEGVAACNAHAAELMAQIEEANDTLKNEMMNRKLIEEELRLTNRQMESRVKERTAELTTVNEQLMKEITEREKAEKILKERAEQLIHHQSTLLNLAKTTDGDFPSITKTITEQDALTLDVERVSIWFFNTDKSELICSNLYDKSAKSHQKGPTLKAADYSAYFKTMDNSRILATTNAQRDVRTSEFTRDYLVPLGITSMMDVPIWLHGKIVGVLCHEHVGPERKWTPEEQDFAASVADMISLKLEAVERRKAENALEKLNKDLALTVEELRRSNSQLQDFIHIAAHDLKTPLRGIGTLADWLVIDYADKFDRQGRDQVELLVARVKRIDKLIDAMLQYSRIKRSRQKEQPVDLNSIIDELIDDLQPSADVEITVTDKLPAVTCEKEHVAQVFRNLLSNAIEYIDKARGKIFVGCTEQGDSWKFSVSDNGPGIEEKHFDRIFRIFQTLSTRDELSRTGVGLTIAKKIVEMYGGKIWVESELGKGSTFYFTFHK